MMNEQVNNYPLLREYYDPYSGLFIFPEYEYDASEALRKEVNKYLKEAVVYDSDGKVDNYKCWILELIWGLDGKTDENTWLYSIRETDIWM